MNAHRGIFDVMVSLGSPIDLVTLCALLEARNELAHIGGATYLASLIDGVPRTDSIEFYCRIVKYKSRERRAISALDDAMSRLVDGEENLEPLLLRVESTLAKIREAGGGARAVSGVYPTLDDLFSAEFAEPEAIIFGVHRGEVAGVLAVTNYGKSTLLFNVALSLAAGITCWPLAPQPPSPRRVLYIDSESPAARAKADLQIMSRDVLHSEGARANFVIVVDAAIDDQPLNLSKPDHFRRITALAKAHRVDLVIVDTAASAFELQDENSNAEVTRRVMNPLKRLAREVNCAVIFTHHIGKSNETQTGEAAYRGRGASAFGALSRTVFTIERDAKKGPAYVVLHCAKIKGRPFEAVLLRLNHDTRWFEICDERPEAKSAPPTAQEIADFVSERQEASTDEIKGHFAVRASSRTVDDRIKEAKQLGLIWKPNQQAPWRVCTLRDDDSLRAQRTSESIVNASPQVRKPYKGLQTAHPRPNGASKTELANCPGCGAQGLLNSHCDRCGEFLRDAEV